MVVRSKEVSPELRSLYEETIQVFTKDITGTFIGGIVVAIVPMEHWSPNIYFYDFAKRRDPIAEIGSGGQSLVFRPYSVKGHNGDVYLDESIVLAQMQVLPELIRMRIQEVQALELGVAVRHVHKFTDPNYVPPQQKKKQGRNK